VNKTAFAVHAWAGLLAGVLLLVMSLTGSALVLADEADRLVKPELRVVEPGPCKASLERMVRCVGRCLPGVSVEGLTLPDGDTAPAVVHFREGGKRLRAYVNPYSGKLLGVEDPSTTWRRVALKLHASFLLGKRGELAALATGVLLLVSILTGVFVYRRAILSVFQRGVRFRSGSRALVSDVHTLIGVSALAFHIVIGLTGVWMLRDSVVDAFTTPSAKPVLAAESSPATRRSGPACASSFPELDGCLDASRGGIAGFVPRSIDLPRKPGAPVRVHGRAPGNPLLARWNSVDVDAETCQVVSVARAEDLDAGRQFDRMAGSLHFGNFGGLPVKVLYAVLGLTPGILSVTGFVLWWRRRRRPRPTTHPAVVS
jgi:uncharacterized iron-regulated membrane protein